MATVKTPTRTTPVRATATRTRKPVERRPRHEPVRVAPVRKLRPEVVKVHPASIKRVNSVKPRIPQGWEGGVRVLGIDPGEHSGLAFFEDGQLMRMRECKPEQLPKVLSDVSGSVALVVFEDSRLAKAVWTSEGSLAKRLKMARNVGEIDAWCRLIEAICGERGIPCIGMPPSSKAGGKHGGKLDAGEFEAFSGYQGATNEHKRDAAMIAWPFRGVKP